MLSLTDQEILIRNSVFGLVLYGKVTAAAAPAFTVPSLAAFGAGKFADVTNPWWVYVLRDALGTGAAPQGEQQQVVAYNNVTGTFATNAFTAPIAVGDEVLILNPNIAAIISLISGKPNVQEITIRPVAAAASIVNAILNNDGTAPLYAPNPADNSDSNNPAIPGIAWTQAISFEQTGAGIVVIDFFSHLEWQTMITVGGGDATNSLSMIQVSGDGGATWVNMTDLFTNPNIAMTPITREGARIFVAAITIGANQLQFRLIHYTDDTVGGAGRSVSSAQIHENSFVNIAYRKL